MMYGGFVVSNYKKYCAYHIKYSYSTAQFKLDICMCVLVQSLKKYVRELANFSRVHNLCHPLDPRDKAVRT